jgi:RimJ/RimL family protein N-acetyltransferase
MLTAALRLQLLGADDAPLYRALYTCPRVMAQIGPPLTAAEADDAFARVCAHNRRPGARHRAWSIRDRSTAAPRGLLALQRDGASAEIGLMLLPQAWSPAVAREAIAAALAQGFDHLDLETVWADCREGPSSRALRRLLEPFGFARVAARRAGHAEWRIDRRARAAAPARHPVAFASPSG